ncbi:mechanosensitive ion channel family protein [Ramlibacter monticola]|uniref:Small-conductance mechanosensitive channel n=2 Tax=Ramlibacter monticola TaxID=1926872 RepID=A0A937CW43_9BURK|nr:mechanosensitive ion channel family protein [Ramlibacter monticola]
MALLPALFLGLFANLFLALPAAQAAEQAADASAAAATDDEAVVTVFDRPIAVFRAPLFGLSPAARASRTQGAIRELLARGGPGVVTAQKEPQGNVVLIDGALALILTQQDVDTVRRETLDAATQASVAALTNAIAETREARDRGKLLRALGFSALATLLFLLAAWGVLRARNALAARTGRLLEHAAERARLDQQPLWEATRAHAFGSWLVRSIAWLLLALLSYQWLVFVLQQFPATRVRGEQMGDFVLALLEDIGAGAVRALPDLIVAGVIFLLARALIVTLRPLFDRVEQGDASTAWLDRDMARPTRRLVSVAIWLFAIVMAYPYLPGSQSEAFKGMSVLVGLMITLGGSSLIGQGFSGLILMYSRVLRPGEFVRIGDQQGTVVELGTFTTRIRTGLGQEVTLPNSSILGQTTINYSRTVRGQGYILDTTLTIGYDTPWREVQAILLEAARRTEGVRADDPAPRVIQTALTDYAVEYRLVCHATPERPQARAEVMHALHANVLDVFNEHGVQIMSPHYEADPEQPKIVGAGHPYAAPARRPATEGAAAEGPAETIPVRPPSTAARPPAAP